MSLGHANRPPKNMHLLYRALPLKGERNRSFVPSEKVLFKAIQLFPGQNLPFSRGPCVDGLICVYALAGDGLGKCACAVFQHFGAISFYVARFTVIPLSQCARTLCWTLNRVISKLHFFQSSSHHFLQQRGLVPISKQGAFLLSDVT
jgi:hypothetical protein